MASTIKHTKVPTIDAWTLVHTLFGVVMALLLRGSASTGIGVIIALAVIWEIIEPHLWPRVMGHYNEDLRNSAMDVGVAVAGAAFVYAII